MKNTKCLIVTCGFFGDIFFASSLAKKLKNKYSQIDYLIGFPQVHRLIQNNPYIDNVYVSEYPGPYPQHTLINYSEYDKVIKLSQLNYLVTPCEEYQQLSDIEDYSPEYEIYTEPEFDKIAKNYCDDLRKTYNKPVIAIMSNWESKTYIFTKEQYIKGIDIPNLGYGGSHRDIKSIVKELEKYFTLIYIGVGELNQLQTLNIPEEDTKSLLFETSILKYCDAFVGTDGGLATIAAGVNTKTIITGDFNLQLYGWNGVLKKIDKPKLGPYEYFGEPHVVLDPYLTDKEVINNIIKLLK
tara:strand:- start:5706 stop:6596 length:891 start_codon:yes stop_codon:yes gene_type:complete